MPQPIIQTAFHAGEWAPALNARVDLAKYHSAAALLRNFFVDYRGGASSCMGTKYILQAYKSATKVRLIAFTASFTINYILEFGDRYVRFYRDGAPILEPTFAISGATQANPAVLTVVGNNYAIGDWIYVAGVIGMTQLNGKYYSISNVVGNAVTLADLNGVAINSTAYTAYGSVGTTARVYTLPSPYLAADLPLLKFAQNVNTMTFTNINYVPYVLTLISNASWTFVPIPFGATISPPSAPVLTSTLGVGTVNYAYVVTSIDDKDQESVPSPYAALGTLLDLRTTGGTNTVTWTAVSGAQFYNIYKAELRYSTAVPSGSQFGFAGFATGVVFIDSNIDPDFSETPPIAQNPFQGAGVASITVTSAGVYTAVPAVTLTAAPVGGVTATASAVLGVVGTPTVVGNGLIYVAGSSVRFSNGVVLIVATAAGGHIITFQPITFPGSNPGAITGGATPANPVTCIDDPGVTANLVWGVVTVSVVSGGAGYTAVPAVAFTAGAPTAGATAILGTSSAGNPAVCTYFQQRLVLAGPPQSPQTFYMSQPGSYYNFNISNPIQPDDAIVGVISSSQLNTIKALIPMPSGLVVFGDRQAWLVNGGSAGAAITPIDATAQAQAYNGSSDVPPITVNYDIIYVQSKGSTVRDLTYNFYTNIYTGTDISILSSHLFYGYKINEWAYAEEPFKLIWAVRNDGTMLCLTFVKEQEIIGWSHRDTQGSFSSVASVTESVVLSDGRTMTVDAVYFCVQRTINGFAVQYIERMAERIFPNGVRDAWCVDAGLQYIGPFATNFSGGEHLAGRTVTGIADGGAITPFVMPVSGNFTLPLASRVIVGLAFTPQLQTLPLDMGEPTVQTKRKRIIDVNIRCQETLGLSIGKTFTSLVPMKDLVRGNVGSQTNEVVNDLVTGDAMTIIDPSWDPAGQYCIEQPLPYPCTILGVIPTIVVGDTK